MSQARAYWYYHMVATDSEQVQKLGVVRIAYLLDQYPEGGPDNELMRMGVKVQESVPLRPNALYVIANSSFWIPTVELLLVLCTPFMRVRTRTIAGEYCTMMLKTEKTRIGCLEWRLTQLDSSFYDRLHHRDAW
jgi:hypothetical protein